MAENIDWLTTAEAARYLKVNPETLRTWAREGSVSAPKLGNLGVFMFIPYAIVYTGFVAINLIKPTLMEAIIIFGLNLAVVYGFGLILFALILALIYNHKCASKENKLNTGDSEGECN